MRRKAYAYVHNKVRICRDEAKYILYANLGLKLHTQNEATRVASFWQCSAKPLAQNKVFCPPSIYLGFCIICISSCMCG